MLGDRLGEMDGLILAEGETLGEIDADIDGLRLGLIEGLILADGD